MSVNCIVCNTLSDDNFINVKELQLGLQEDFTYQICNHCGSAMLMNPPTDMGKYYPNEDYYSFTLKVDIKDKPDLLRSIKSSYLLFNRHKILGSLLSIGYKMPEHYEWMKYTKTKYNDAILDVGTGNGSLLVKLNEIGFTNLTGIDPFLNESKDYGNIKIHKKSIDDVVEMYDTVMLHHALEHVFEPKKVLQKVKEILKPGGSCLIRIPIMGNYGWQQYKSNWCGLDAPRHIFIPSEKGLKLMAEEAGFVIEKFVYDSSDYVIWCSEQYKNNIPLHAAKSYSTNKTNSLFPKEKIKEFKKIIKEQNLKNNGDTAAMYLRKL